ncbi:uncharacterized protein [Typha angustifolia]|uniref:uncharacterized protein isoform X1 n=1 Tax=Typha angustifolia TaxID=59011 RepID=UPI003C2EBC0D
MSPSTAAAGQFGDTTLTKIFVGGLAWETQKDSLGNYFEQFGEILEAVVITDKNSGRSKGYGFVTFREADAATRACVDPSPVIDGRRANCNLASLGLQKSRPTTPGQYGGSKSFRRAGGMQGGLNTALPSFATFPHYAIHQGIPYNAYGYSLYPTEYAYPACSYQSYCNIYGEAANQYQVYRGATTGTVAEANAFYPNYFQFGQGYRVQPPQMLQYCAAATVAGVTGFAGPQQYGRPMPLAATAAAQAGMTMDLTAPNQPTPTTMAHHYRLTPNSLQCHTIT